jgi:hypothetical protein
MTSTYEYPMKADEINALSFHLQPFHAVFKMFWQLGTPFFSSRQPTAAIWFDKKTGDFIRFDINQQFWDEQTIYQKCFVAAHECIHVILNHPKRMKDFKDAMLANKAADLVDNHMLVERFGMDRLLIDPDNRYCWVDKFFKPEENIPTNGTLEYYYDLLNKKQEAGELPNDAETVDSHASFGSGEGEPSDGEGTGEGEGGDASSVIDQLNEMLGNDDKNALKDILEKHGESASPNSQAGKGGGPGQWTFIATPKIKKKKWETIIKKWALKRIGVKAKYMDQWAVRNRRYFMIGKDLMIPNSMEQEIPNLKKDRIKVYFYLDTSGSCHHLAARFFKAAATLPEDRFDVRLFCFHDYVQETTILSGKAHLGGGTNFGIIEAHIQNIMKTEGSKYPEGVFVVTDGYGTYVKPEKPSNWHWFISENGSFQYVPKESSQYHLKDFE